MKDKYPEMFKDDGINVVLTTGEEIIRKETVLENVLIQLYGVPAEYFTDKLNWTYFTDLSELRSSTRKSFKIGRNDPCPCGSNSKFKRCCGT